MCGIIAYTGTTAAAPFLMDGLARLTYRGYDSAGIAVNSRKRLKCWKSAGRLEALQQILPTSIAGNSGIGHTRWATHGAPSDANAHPHLDASERFAVIHNGIIENADVIRTSLEAQGVTTTSETDSELIVLLLASTQGPFLERVRWVLAQIRGTYGLALLDAQSPGTIIIAKNASPVILGTSDSATFAASDELAIARHVERLVHLEEGDIAVLTPSGFQISTLDASPAVRVSHAPSLESGDYDKGPHAHFLYREISDQPEALERTLSGRLDHRFSTAHLGGLNLDARALLGVQRIRVLGCGSAHYAGRSGALMIESLARIPCDAEPAAEFRYRNPVIESGTLYIVASQSGESFDTLAAVREIRRKGGFVLGIVNRVGSSIAREVDGGIYMHVGPEVSVASSKACSGMLSCFALLAVMLGRMRDLSPQHGAQLLQALEQMPARLREVLSLEDQIEQIAMRIAPSRSVFFLGRTEGFPIALEGAQKLKELSYIHAEAYPSSELKHGPLALIDKDTPCIVILPDTELLDKSMSSLEEIKSRNAPVIAITDSDRPRIDELSDMVLRLPSSNALVQPIVTGVALQLLAYHAALKLGRDIDQPRNLAKSVTVE